MLANCTAHGLRRLRGRSPRAGLHILPLTTLHQPGSVSGNHTLAYITGPLAFFSSFAPRSSAQTLRLPSSNPRSRPLRSSDDTGPHQPRSADHAIHIPCVLQCRRPGLLYMRLRLAGAVMRGQHIQCPGRGGQLGVLAASFRTCIDHRGCRQWMGLLFSGH